MRIGAKEAVIFLAGCGTGFLASLKWAQKRCEDRARAEIDAVKEELRKRHQEELTKEAAEAARERAQQQRRCYERMVAGLGYREENAHDIAMQTPYVIPPEQFGELDEYEQITLVYYSDGVLTGEDERPMSNETIDELVGRESLTRFGEYEEDTVLVRNDRLKVDYEIRRDLESYAELLRDKPWLAR